jgi:hypothetical protein
MICSVDYYDRIHLFLEKFPYYKERIDQLHFEFSKESVLGDPFDDLKVYTKEYVYHKDCILKGTAKLRNHFRAEILYILTPIFSRNNSIKIKFLVKLHHKEGLFLVPDADFVFD